MTKAEWNHAVDAYIASQNQKIGKPVKRSPEIASSFPQAHTLITEEVIRDYACNIGDNNPLYNSPAYAKKTRWGGMIAPAGGFVRYIAETGSFARDGALEGFSYLYGGTVYDCYDVIRAGDTFTIHDEFMGVEEKVLPPEKAEKYRLLSITDRRDYINQAGKTVISATGNVLITCVYPGDLSQNSDSAVYGKVDKPRYTAEELDEIYRYYEDYQNGKYTRGSTPRYWEDVQEGEAMPMMIKGPMEVIDMVSFACAIGSTMGSASTKWETIRTLHDTRDPETNIWLTRDAFHYSDSYARAMGFPLALTYGALVESYLAEAVCDWMGDDGFIKKLSHQQRRACFHGDVIRIKGHVSRKYEENGEHLVELTFWAENQKGVKLNPSKAIVKLPVRDE